MAYTPAPACAVYTLLAIYAHIMGQWVMQYTFTYHHRAIEVWSLLSAPIHRDNWIRIGYKTIEHAYISDVEDARYFSDKREGRRAQLNWARVYSLYPEFKTLLNSPDQHSRLSATRAGRLAYMCPPTTVHDVWL